MNDDFWKKAGEAIDAQVKELAEKRAINTAKQLNEIHGAARKEMNNETLIEQLKRAEHFYVGEVSPLFRKAVEKIERLELEIKDYKGLVVSSNDKYNEAAAEIERLEDRIGRSNSKFVEMAGKLKETNDKYNLVTKNNDELLKMYESVRKERDKLIEENKWLTDALKNLNDNHCATVKQSIYESDKLKRLEEEVRKTALINKSFPGYETVHINESEVNWNDDLSVRDHIAIAAMEGTLSAQGWHPEYIIPAGGGHVGGQRAADAVAEQAYIYADAMLKVRKVGERK
jgi:chromosome segregation ATPase